VEEELEQQLLQEQEQQEHQDKDLLEVIHYLMEEVEVVDLAELDLVFQEDQVLVELVQHLQ
jgi:hypothetical protein